VNSLKSKITTIFKNAKIFLVNFLTKIIPGKKEINENNISSQTELDKKLIYSLSKSKIPNLRQIKYLKRYLSPREKWIMRISFIVIFFSLLFLAYNIYTTKLQLVPIEGGKYVEGLIGSPKYINPLYAQASDVDSDMEYLVFSRLFKRDVESSLKNDLVKNYSVSDDGKIYSFEIRDDIKWHTGESLTADDVIFTFHAIKDIQYNSPLRSSFSGVDIEKTGDYAFNFLLSEPYAPFLELLTFGILPGDLWFSFMPESASLAELNLKPIGSGPYKFKSLIKDKAGRIREINLVLNNDYYGEKPLVEEVSFVFFDSFEESIQALNDNKINGISYLPPNASESLVSIDSLQLHKMNLPQVNALFFNQEIEILKNKEIKQVLAYAINKNQIISDDLNGEARIVQGPILSSSFAYNNEIKKYNFDIEEAKKILDEDGWEIEKVSQEDLAIAEENKENEDEDLKEDALEKLLVGEGQWLKKDGKYLVLNLTTVEIDENIKIANRIQEYWQSIGVKTNLNIVSPVEIQPEIIIPRKYDVLLYGQILGNDPDLYVFWHSSQASEIGLNLSNYENKDLDKILEEARLSSDTEFRKEKYYEFQKIILDDLPAVFLYSPYYTYVQDKKIKGFEIKNILMPRDRFSNISNWYIKTGKRIVW